MLPFWPGAVLFGVVYAVAARAAGLTGAETLGMSVLVHAGSAQFAATGLIGSGAGPIAVTLATAITNARYVLMSASVAPRIVNRPVWWRLLFAWQLSDESYAVTTARTRLRPRVFSQEMAIPRLHMARTLAWSCPGLVGR